ncbi:hypothetical protein GUITHDRAFT_146002 [Guillardia theta CCMP2712]|uniref:Uncharacterized protein n=1 Tax=Guillardia theta (strain CCMP2712) TaxID=905079 RepID=L1IIY0_GUITC|nr:hypothetical protein GUITHDRAFT_146002 [Guillardia theta CCMP2712]EKX36196.1 hypothetical protein GUITHDRAFT_146002 [Guillardia theta CCMP2712]|eukprot:XP_005823176.1 hypothetical protein GUITHDRAFT_146002 [Guillardia theta CCMP2712]
MSNFFGNLNNPRMPEVVMNQGPLPPLSTDNLPYGLNGTANARINYNNALLGDITPYVYGDSARITTQTSYLNVPYRIQKIVPELYLPPIGEGRGLIKVSHAVDYGDIAWTLRLRNISATLGVFMKSAEGIRDNGTHITAFINLSTVNYILLGFQNLYLRVEAAVAAGALFRSTASDEAWLRLWYDLFDMTGRPDDFITWTRSLVNHYIGPYQPLTFEDPTSTVYSPYLTDQGSGQPTCMLTDYEEWNGDMHDRVKDRYPDVDIICTHNPHSATSFSVVFSIPEHEGMLLYVAWMIFIVVTNASVVFQALLLPLCRADGHQKGMAERSSGPAYAASSQDSEKRSSWMHTSWDNYVFMVSFIIQFSLAFSFLVIFSVHVIEFGYNSGSMRFPIFKSLYTNVYGQPIGSQRVTLFGETSVLKTTVGGTSSYMPVAPLPLSFDSPSFAGQRPYTYYYCNDTAFTSTIAANDWNRQMSLCHIERSKQVAMYKNDPVSLT